MADKSDDQSIKESKAVVTKGLTNQKIIDQMTSSGETAQKNRPNAMARHQAAAAAKNQGTASSDGGEHGEKQ